LNSGSSKALFLLVHGAVDGIGEACECLVVHLYGNHSQRTQLFRLIRDGVLENTAEGREMIKLYYQWSPVLVMAAVADAGFKEEIEKMIDRFSPLLGSPDF